MENISINVDDGSGKAYDEKLSGRLSERGDLAVTTKDRALKSGAAGVVITFTANDRDGNPIHVQAVTSMKLFLATAKALTGVYDDNGMKR